MTLPAINVRGLLGKACGLLGWSPEAFWESQYWEVVRALEHYYQERHERQSLEAHQRALLAYEIGAAHRAKRWDPPEASDFYEGQPVTRAARMHAERRKQDRLDAMRAEKEKLKEIFPRHRPPIGA